MFLNSLKSTCQAPPFLFPFFSWRCTFEAKAVGTSTMRLSSPLGKKHHTRHNEQENYGTVLGVAYSTSKAWGDKIVVHLLTKQTNFQQIFLLLLLFPPGKMISAMSAQWTALLYLHISIWAPTPSACYQSCGNATLEAIRSNQQEIKAIFQIAYFKNL